jgi:methyl-accepting chemotaxis protein
MKKKIRISILLKIAGLSSGFLFIAVFVLAMYSINQMVNVSLEASTVIVQNKLRGDLNSVSYIISDVYGELRLENNHLVDDQHEPLDERYDTIDQISTNFSVVATIFQREGSDYRRITTSIIDTSGKRAVGTMLGTNSAAYQPVSAGNTYVGQATILGKEYIAGYEPIFTPNTREVIGILFVGVEMSSVMASAHEMIDSRINRGVFFIALLAAAMLIIAVILTVFIFKSILIKPVNTIVSVLEAAGGGDLTQTVGILSNDEIGDLAHHVNQTLESIKNLAVIIKKRSAALSDIGTDLTSNMADTAASINQMNAHIQSIKDRIAHQSVSVAATNEATGRITASIDRLNENTEQQSASVAQTSSAIEEMIANIQSVTQTLIKNAERVNELSRSSEIGRSGLHEVAGDIQEIARESEGLLEINAVMKNIASQTNLLSMNAAIEAAHAGEAGKGFAVVADEIRKLAESSGDQSKTIGTVLKKIKGSIDKISRSTGEVLNKFEAIDSGVKTVAEQEANIRKAMEEQNAGSRQLLEAAGKVAEITQLVKSGSGEMFEGSRRVISEGKNLEMAAEEIANGIGEISAGAVRIGTAVNRVNSISVDNKENISILANEVSRFKVETHGG